MFLTTYRKIDILNRVLTLNVGDIEKLNSVHISEVKNSPNNDLMLGMLINSFQNSPNNQDNGGYFNIKDIKLIMASLSYQQLQGLFSHITLKLLGMDSGIRINPKVLESLKFQLDEKNFSLIINHKPSNNHKVRLSKLLVEYSYNDLVSYIMANFFSELTKQLPEQIEARFNVSKYPQTLFSYLSPEVWDEVFIDSLKQYLPSTFAVIKSFN